MRRRKFGERAQLNVAMAPEMKKELSEIAALVSDREGREGRTVKTAALVRLGVEMVMDLPATEIKKRLRKMESA